MEGECVILGDVITLIINSVKSVASNIKNSSGRAKQGFFAVVAVVAIIASLSFTGTRIAYKVNYSGNIIATVSQKNHFDKALQLVVNMVGNDDVKSAVEKPTFSTTLVLDENINNTQELADAIIDHTDEIVKASTLYVNGNDMLTAEKSVIDSVINNRLNSYNVDGNDCNSRFAETVETKDGYFMVREIEGKNKVENVVRSLNVVTEMRETSDEVVPYTSTVQKTNEQVVGYKKVTVSGVSGVNRVTRDIVMVNGEVQSSTTVDTEVIVAPVNEVIVKGTAKTAASAEQKQIAHNAGFIFPLPAGTWRVSSYYGDGRRHKGVDICAKSGTDIYAVADGKVVMSRWNGDYGYCVIIEHADGTRTLYGHAKQLCCNVGDTVSQGEVIALVGTTGQSTGNHVHFEVIAKGRNVDPAPYINLD